MKKNVLSFTMSVIVVMCLFFESCSFTHNNAPDISSTEVKEATIPNEKKYDGSTAEYINEKYSSVDYDGYTFRILGNNPGYHYYYLISDEANEIWYEEDSAEVQQHAVFTRNILCEDLINIKISLSPGGDAYEMYDRARIMAQAGVDDFDLVQTSHFRGFMSGMLGYYYNLYDVDSFDIGAYWWNQEYVDCYTHDFNNLTTITGDALIFDDLAACAIFYNTAMVENFNLPDPTVIVDNGEWTIETMMEMAHSVTSDTDGDGQMTRDDTWGLIYDRGVAVIAFFDGCNIRLAEKDENDIPYLAAEEAQVVNVVQYVYENISRSGCLFSEDEETNREIFKSDRALFSDENLCAMFKMRDMESDFRLLPLPKLNLDQKKYSTVQSGAVTSILAIPITVKDTDRVGNILNVFGGLSTDTVDQSLNEVILGAKLVRDKRTVEMLKIIIDSKYYDWAKDLKWAFPIYQAMTDQGNADQFYFVSKLKSVARQSRSMLKMFLGGYSFY